MHTAALRHFADARLAARGELEEAFLHQVRGPYWRLVR